MPGAASAARALLGRVDSQSLKKDEIVALHWQTNLVTLFILVAPLAAIGLVRGGLVKVWDCCVVEKSCANAWRLHAQALLLLVLPQKSTISPDLSASGHH